MSNETDCCRLLPQSSVHRALVEVEHLLGLGASQAPFAPEFVETGPLLAVRCDNGFHIHARTLRTGCGQ